MRSANASPTATTSMKAMTTSTQQAARKVLRDEFVGEELKDSRPNPIAEHRGSQ